MNHRNESSWFAVVVRPNHERAAEHGLRNQGFEAFLPLHRVRRRWSDRVKELDSVLFPGYVFCRFANIDRRRILNSPSVRSIVGIGTAPLRVEDHEITSVRTLVSSGCPLFATPYIRAGQHVKITEGPLSSLRGIVTRVKESWRVVVSVEALSCSVAIEVDADMIAPAVVSYGS